MDNPCDRDFAQLVSNDFKMVETNFDIDLITNTSDDIYKASVKKNIRKSALGYLNKVKQTHSKVKEISYDDLKIQPYLKSPLFTNQETSLLFALRSRTNDIFKANFRNMYGNVVPCPLECWDTDDIAIEDTQKHLLNCDVIKAKYVTADVASGDVEYEDIFGNVKKQKEAVVLFTRLLEVRTEIIKEKENPPVDVLDPSMGANLCYSDIISTAICCTNCISIGK